MACSEARVGLTPPLSRMRLTSSTTTMASSTTMAYSKHKAEEGESVE